MKLMLYGREKMNCEQQRGARKRVCGEPGTSEERQDSLGKGYKRILTKEFEDAGDFVDNQPEYQDR